VPEALTTRPEAAFGVARSFSGRRWQLEAGDETLARQLQQELTLSPVLARILAARGIPVADAYDYLNPTLKKFLPDPRLLAEMDLAVARVKRALESGERIAIFGDYDVDGSTSTALLGNFLTALGAPPRLYIPDRMTEGYGPSAPALLALKAEGDRGLRRIWRRGV
jgi:single-stranded-DNA-specific exonuclease